jgi:hypothetical protein
MRPRNVARPAAAGALCFAFSCAGAQTALAQTETPSPTPVPVPVPAAGPAPEPRIGVQRRKLHVRAGKRTAVVGKLAPRLPGIRVSLQLRRDGRWKAIDRDRTDRRGRYKLRERLRRTGTAKVRVRVAGGPAVKSGKRVIGRLHVYRYAHASWYGPGLYGNSLACGGRLGTGTVGVAHKWLPCGTMVTFKRGGRELRVPVIDRGPYVGGREYDLTAATARKLRFSGHGPILTTR